MQRNRYGKKEKIKKKLNHVKVRYSRFIIFVLVTEISAHIYQNVINMLIISFLLDVISLLFSILDRSI